MAKDRSKPKSRAKKPRRAVDSLTVSILQATLESTADGMLVVDLDGKIVSYNRRFEEIWSLPRAFVAANNDAAGRRQIIERVSSQLVNPQVFVDGIQERYDEPQSDSFDILDFKDGRVIERYSIPLRLDHRSVGRVWSFRDVTARRRAECVQEAVYRISHTAHTAENLQELLGAIHGIVGELMPARNFYVSLYNEKTDQLEFPYFVDQIDTTCDVRPRKLRKGLTEYVLRTGQPLLATPDVYERLVAAGEAELIGAPSIDWLGVPLKVKERTIGVVVTQTYEHGVRYGESERDILTFVSSQMAMAIERKRVEDAWREQSELLQRIVDNIPVMLVCLDEQGGLHWGNREWTHTLGYDIGEARGRDIFTELYPDPGERQRLRDSIGAPVGQWMDFRTRTKTGAILDTIWANAPLTGGGWLAIGMDVTDRKRAEERYRSFIAQSSEGVSRLEIDPPVPINLTEEEQVDRLYAGGLIAECNDAMARMYGFDEADELLGTRLSDLHTVSDPANREQIRTVIRAGYRISDSETREHDREGRPRVFLNNVIGFIEDGHLVRVWGTQRDVTEQRHLEEQFRQSQKMEAVGQLAGGIAHDFNNLLTAILGNTQLLLRDLPAGDAKRGDVEEIRKASERAASLTRQLLAYSRRQMLQPVVLDLNIVVAEMDKMLRRLIGEHIALATVLAPDLGSSFKIYLPRITDPTGDGGAAPKTGPRRGTETVLVVEDEPAVLSLSRRALEAQGYIVLAAGDAPAAMRIVERHGGTIHLLLTDVVMPGLSGQELADQLVSRRPGIRVLYMSGYPGDAVVQHGTLPSGTAFLQKPFSPDTLARKVRDVLDA